MVTTSWLLLTRTENISAISATNTKMSEHHFVAFVKLIVKSYVDISEEAFTAE